MGAITHSNLDDVFSYHKPKNDFQIEKYHRIRKAAKECALVMLDQVDDKPRHAAIQAFREVIYAETGGCRDQQEALGMLLSADAFIQGVGVAIRGGAFADPVEQSEATQAVISCIRAAVMWTNASVALEGRI